MNRRVWLIAVLMAVLTSLPYVVATFSAPSGTYFSGVILNPVDYNSHLAKMQQGAQGKWLYELLFTPEPHQPIFLQTFYVALGHIVRWTKLSFDLVFHIARVLCTVLMVLAIWAFLSHFLKVVAAWWALLLCLFGVGTSYLILFIAPNLYPNISPIEFWLYDAYTFMSAFIAPHFAAGIALLATSFLAMDKWLLGIEQTRNSVKPPTPQELQAVRRNWLILWAATLGLAILQPFDLILVDAVLAVVIVWKVERRRFSLHNVSTGAAILGLTHMIVLGYDSLSFQLPVWNLFSEQNITHSPPPLFYLLGYGLMLIPAILGIISILNRRDERWLIPALWLIGVAILVYAPLQTQRRYLLGVQVPMAALAVYRFIVVVIPALRIRIGQRYSSFLSFYGVVVSVSTFVVLGWLIMNTRLPELYISDATDKAWQWIKSNTPHDSIIMSDFMTGGSIAARTGRRVVLGHWIETAEYEDKRLAIAGFFSDGATDEWRQAFLNAMNVSYIWYGAEEKDVWDPLSVPWLQKVYEDNGITLFEVNHAGR